MMSSIDQGHVEVGQLLGGRFRLLEKIATDPAGAQYRAETAPEGSPCLVRILPSELPSAKAAGIIEVVEMIRAGSWEHQVATDVILREGALVALITPALEGERLADVMTTVGALPWELARELVWAIGAAVAELHAREITIGGLAPARCFLSRENGGVTVRLLDVGVVHNDATTADAAWISPEQAAGAAPSPRSDVYALATMLYAMTTGTPPFTGEPTQVALMHRFKAPRPLRLAHPEHGLSPALEAAIMRGLEKDPQRRFPGVPAMLAAFAVAESNPADPRRPGDPPTLLVAPLRPTSEATQVLQPIDTSARALAERPPQAPPPPSARPSAPNLERTAVLAPLLQREAPPPEATALIPGFGGALLEEPDAPWLVAASPAPSVTVSPVTVSPVTRPAVHDERVERAGSGRLRAIESAPLPLLTSLRRLWARISRLRALPGRLLARLVGLRGRFIRLWSRLSGGLGV
jgi:serine/threonine protein kinase